jgi:hypothetical protein
MLEFLQLQSDRFDQHHTNSRTTMSTNNEVICSLQSFHTLIVLSYEQDANRPSDN